MNRQNKLFNQIGRAGIGTSLSRVLGYLRDMLVAHAFGAGLAADAFYAAYRIPNLLRRLFGEGALSASFIPVFSQYLKTKSKEETQYFINVLFSALFTLLSLLTILGIIFAPQLATAIAWGFRSDPDKLALTISLTRIMFPFLLFVCMAALALGTLNTLGSFFVPAVAPASLSVSEIVFILALAPLLSEDSKVAGLAISVTIGGLCHFLVQWPRIKKFGWKIEFLFLYPKKFFSMEWLKHPGLQKVGMLMIPAMIGISVDQINTFVNTICASFLQEGSITALYYSNRLMQMPLAIFGIATATVALPSLSKAVAEKNVSAYNETLNFSLRFSLFILIPAAVGLMIIGLPIIRVLFEHGRFDIRASMLTNSALFFYCMGLPAYAAARILANAFYAFQNTKTPVKVAAAAMLINVILCIALMKPMGVSGLALATSVSSWINVFILYLLLQHKTKAINVGSVVLILLKILICSSIMGIVCYLVAFRLVADRLILGMIASLFSGVVIYFVIAALLNIDERKLVWSTLIRK